MSCCVRCGTSTLALTFCMGCGLPICDDCTPGHPCDEETDLTQPAPTANEHPPIVPQVIADLEARMQLGIERYSVALQPANGRHMLTDAYEEAQDLAVYLKGAIETDRLRQQLVNELVAAAKDALVFESSGTLHRLQLAVTAVEAFNGGRT